MVHFIVSSTDGLSDEMNQDTSELYKFDHGCQFFRADTPAMKAWTHKLFLRGYVRKWNGPHEGSTSADFFGLPNNKDHIFISNQGGMHTIARDLINEVTSSSCHFCAYPTMRVATMERDETSNLWRLYGVGQRAGSVDPKDILDFTFVIPLSYHCEYFYVLDYHSTA